MTYVLGFRKISNRCLLIILLFALGSLERTDALCGKPGLTPVCRLDVAKEEYEVAEKVTYKCTDCHTFDKIERHCLRNGSWSGHIPVCHKLISMKNVRSLRFVNSTSTANSTMDNSTQTCSDKMSKPDPVWEVVLTKSFQISVVKVTVPAHAVVDIVVKIRDGNNLEKSCRKYSGRTESARRTIVYLCEKGIRGDRVRIIQPNTGVALCEVYLHSLTDKENCLRPDSPFLAKGRTSISGNITSYIFYCNSSYELVGDPEVICKGGTWSKSSAFCRKKEMIPQGPHCHSLPNVINGFLRVNTTSINSIAYLKCHEGYMPQGADRVYCLTSGKWTPNDLTCKVIECETNPTIRHGKGVLVSKSALWGTKLQIICNPGFIAIDPELRACHKNATWGNLDICVEISCGAFISGTSDAEKWVSFNEKNSIRVLVCENGYYIEGSPAVTQCLPNGSWSYTNAVCRKYPVSEGWISEWTPGSLFMSAVAVGAGTAICIVCLFLSFLVTIQNKHYGISCRNERFFSIHGWPRHLQASTSKMSLIKHILQFHEGKHCSSHYYDTDPVYAQPFERSKLEDNNSAVFTAILL
ncbi:hypothetical protein JTE90_004436 [Oedothorax gibbosus]|uniref:Sushi domain-containing protein n=1 Tax=Oedothorax gibbosus TaxID=931172 RepID=A0AAV6UPA5_9ARAC|nr:hypothetical protein JTE90_004436 [Oedothorax gibbosus]